MKFLFACIAASLLACASWASDWVVYEGKEGPGKGKHIVLISGDEEYRSEEALPMLGKILSVRHGFKSTVLFPINPADGTIDPDNQTNIVGWHHLQSADLVILFTRFREPSDADMKHFDDYLQAGKPVIAIRTSTHAFQYSRNRRSPYAKYDWRTRQGWRGGFGQEVLGDTWISHHGVHGKESARGVINGQFANHPILRGVRDVWGPTDVYGIVNLKPTDQVLMLGAVLAGMEPDSPLAPWSKNNPMQPLVWTREYKNEAGNTNRILTSTIGAAVDLQSEDLRRMFVNGCFWALKMEDKIPERANVEFVGEFKPTYFGFKGGKKGVKPSEHELKD